MPIMGPTPVDDIRQPIALADLSPEEQRAVEDRKKAMDELFAEKGARYCLEVYFHHQRSTWKDNTGLILFWESGTMMAGEGDTRMYLCPGRSTGKSDCEAFIPDAAHCEDEVICSECGFKWKTDDILGEVYFEKPARKLADEIVCWMARLNNDCDVVLKYSPKDIRSVTASEAERKLRGELLNPFREDRVKRGRARYRMRDIIKDLASGANINDRIFAFITA